MKKLLIMAILVLTACQKNIVEQEPTNDGPAIDSHGQSYVKGDMALVEIDGCGM